MMLITIGLIYWDILISLVGMGIFIYGKKRPDLVALIAGIIIMVYPYFIGSLGWSIAVGLIILAVYVFLKRVVRI